MNSKNSLDKIAQIFAKCFKNVYDNSAKYLIFYKDFGGQSNGGTIPSSSRAKSDP